MTKQNPTLELTNLKSEPPMKEVAIWDDFRTQMENLKATAETLTVTNVNQLSEMKLARATRLTLKGLRVAIENRRKELGEFHLRETQKINSNAKALRDIIEPLEERLLFQEQFIEREEARIEEEKRVARTAELAPFLEAPLDIDLGKLADENYNKLLAGWKDAHNAKLERERKEKEAIEAAAKAERERIEAQRLENERLKKEAAEREAAAKIEREAAEKERARLAKQVEDERKAAEEKAAKLKKERDAIEAKAKAEREAAEQLALKERQAREKIEAEIAQKKADEQKALEAAKSAPDKKKLTELAKAIRAFEVPEMTTEKGKAAANEVRPKIDALAAWVDRQAAFL